MIVYFAVHSQHQFSVFADEGLLPRCRVYDREPLMRQNGVAARKDTRPIRAAMTQFFLTFPATVAAIALPFFSD